MEERIKAFDKSVRAVTNAGKVVNAFLREHSKEHTAASIELAEKAIRLLDGLEDFPDRAGSLRTAIEEALGQSRKKMDREKALLAGAVAKSLAAAGMKVTGNLPSLTAGPFSLQFTFGAKGLCTLWLGPGKYRLDTAPLDPETIAAMVTTANDRLFGRQFDEAGFLKNLEKAWRMAIIRMGLEPGSRVPVAAVIPEISLMRQKETFLADPRKETYTPYGRIEFAADMARLRNRVTGGAELRMDVATMSQTRKASDHLWIPRTGSMEGTNFATLRFVRATV